MKRLNALHPRPSSQRHASPYLSAVVAGLLLQVIAVTGATAKTIFVAPEHEGWHSNHALHDAVDQAVGGDTISLAPGSYEGLIDLQEPVVLQGAREWTSHVTLTCGGPVIRVLADATIDGLVVDGFTQDCGAGYGVRTSPDIEVVNADPVISNCLLGQSNGLAVRIVGDSGPVIRGCALWGAQGAIELVDSSNDIDAVGNVWGWFFRRDLNEPFRVAQSESEILDVIWDGRDQQGLGFVRFVPWIGVRELIATPVLQATWGRVKLEATLSRPGDIEAR